MFYIIIFTTDNGGQIRKGSSNRPLRGNELGYCMCLKAESMESIAGLGLDKERWGTMCGII